MSSGRFRGGGRGRGEYYKNRYGGGGKGRGRGAGQPDVDMSDDFEEPQQNAGNSMRSWGDLQRLFEKIDGNQYRMASTQTKVLNADQLTCENSRLQITLGQVQPRRAKLHSLS